MAHVDRFLPGRHPLCACPQDVHSLWTGTPPPDRSACAGGTIAHPVLSSQDIDHLVRELRRDRQ